MLGERLLEFLISREEYRLIVIVNRVLRKTFRPKKEQVIGGLKKRA
jgi:hypothetical protein